MIHSEKLKAELAILEAEMLKYYILDRRRKELHQRRIELCVRELKTN